MTHTYTLQMRYWLGTEWSALRWVTADDTLSMYKHRAEVFLSKEDATAKQARIAKDLTKDKVKFEFTVNKEN